MAEGKFYQDFDDDDDFGSRNDLDDDDRDACFESNRFDSNYVLERSQSDAFLPRRNRLGLSSSSLASALSIDGQDTPDHGETRLVSESSRVYFDLSKLDLESESSSSFSTSSKDCRLRVKKNPSLETIHQNEILEVSRQKHHFSSSSSSLRNYSSDALDDIEESDDSVEAEHAAEYNIHSDQGSYYSKYPLQVTSSPSLSNSTDSHAAWQNKHNVKLKYQQFCAKMEKDISELKRATGLDEVAPLEHILESMMEAWNYPIYGRDLSYGLCDIIRSESVLSLLVKNCDSDQRKVLLASSNLLEQVMSTLNRERVAREGLKSVVNMTQKCIGDRQMAFSCTGIIENLFKVNEETSSQVIKHGGLDTILYWSRSKDIVVLRKCAKALSNLSLFGGPENQEIMTQNNVPEWLFPLAFIQDKHVKYYACLSIAVLVANKELEASVLKSGTLDLVLPFVSSEKPDEFARSDYSHRQGRDQIWLERLKPLLYSRRPEAQALAAFHFAMEAAIKSEQGKVEILREIGVIEPLRKVASSPNAVAARLAREALQTIGEEVPHKLSQQVPLWTVEDVSHWVSEVGFNEFCPKFEGCKIDGDLLLQMDESDLQDSIHMEPGMIRKRFLRELINLKITADYSSKDPSKMDPWLMSVLPELSQYTYAMLRCGMDRNLLASTSEEELREECQITNGIHRRIILHHLGGSENGSLFGESTMYLKSSQNSLNRASIDCSATLSVCPRPVDVFISYRRSTGSQLASLLKVHLQLRGFSVFLDIDRLRAGKFDENLLMNIKLAKHFLLVLTTNALDRCIGDDDRQDWVHKEIVTALDSHCNIIPILDNCDWPEPEQLPDDMRQVCYFNGIRWIHDYQDACIDKLNGFILGQAPIEPANPIQSPLHVNDIKPVQGKLKKEQVPVCSVETLRKQSREENMKPYH